MARAKKPAKKAKTQRSQRSFAARVLPFIRHIRTKLHKRQILVAIAAVIGGAAAYGLNGSILTVILGGILCGGLGMTIAWLANRKHRKAEKLARLRAEDEAARQARHDQFRRAQDQWVTNVSANSGVVARSAPTQRTWQEPATVAKPIPVSSPTPIVRPQQVAPPTRRSYQTISVVQMD